MSSDREEVETERGSQRRALPVFNGRETSFPIWKARVRAWLQAATPSLLYVLEESGSVSGDALEASSSSASSSETSGGSGGPGSTKLKKKSEKQAETDRLKVYNLLISALDDTHVGMIVTEVAEGDALGAWKILLRKYERNTLASRNQLRRELHSLRLGASESIDQYKARAMHIVSRLQSSKESVSNGELLYCLLEGLPEGYAVVKQAMEVQDVTDVDVACGHLREVEDKLRRAAGSSSSGPPGGMSNSGLKLDTLLRMSAERRRDFHTRKCLVCGNGGHVASECVNRCGQGCYRCGGRHRVRDCNEDYVESEGSDRESSRIGRREGSEGGASTAGHTPVHPGRRKDFKE
jgi:hypothetical protein